MSGKNYNNNNNTINNNNNDGNMGKCGDTYCSSCMHSNNNSPGGQHTSCTGGGASPGPTAYQHVPPIQVTAKVLFGSVSAISALNAERKKKS